MKLLITGGSGFIGSNFIHYWLNTHPQDHIINLDALTYAGNMENNASFEHDSRYSFVKGDICDKSVVDPLVDISDIIVHFAAESHVDRSILDASPFVKTNIEGTFTLLESALRNKTRFHHISTDEVFGALPLDPSQKFTVKTPYNPRSPYAASKASSDHLVRSYNITYGLPVTITNCSNNYGPYHFPEKMIPLAITNLMEGKKVPIYGDGLYVRDWLYVEDHAIAIDKVITHGTIGNTYLIGGMDEDISNLDLIKLIIKLMGKDESCIEYVTDRKGHDRRYAIDWSVTHDELHWKPSVSLEEGLKKTISWFREHEGWWKRIKSGEYATYYQQQYQQ